MTSNSGYLFSRLFVLLPPQVLQCLLSLALAALQNLLPVTNMLCFYWGNAVTNVKKLNLEPSESNRRRIAVFASIRRGAPFTIKPFQSGAQHAPERQSSESQDLKEKSGLCCQRPESAGGSAGASARAQKEEPAAVILQSRIANSCSKGVTSAHEMR